MADAGFGTEIGRDDDALRWALATVDVVSAPGDWAATPVPGQRAVSIAPGQGQAAQITMPEIAGAKTDAQVVPLAAPAVMTHAGRLICRELLWYGIEQSPPGESRFVVLDAGDFSAFPSALPDWRSLVSTDPASGFVRLPGQRYLVPLHYAVVSQTNEVRLWDLRRVAPNARPGAGSGELIGIYDLPIGYTGTFGFAGEGFRAGLMEASIPDPGIPFRAEIAGHFVGGSNAAGTRVDFDLGYGGTGDGPLAGALHPEYFPGVEGTQFRAFHSLRSEVLTGALTWRLVARRIYGSSGGIMRGAPDPRRFQLKYFTA